MMAFFDAEFAMRELNKAVLNMLPNDEVSLDDFSHLTATLYRRFALVPSRLILLLRTQPLPPRTGHLPLHASSP